VRKSGLHPPARGRVIIRDAASGRWLRFTRLREIVTVRTLAEVPTALQRVEEAVNRDGLYAAGFVSYEAAPAFDNSLVVCDESQFPPLWFGLYERVVELGPAARAPISSRLSPISKPEARIGRADALSRLEVGAPDWRQSVQPAEFHRAIARIKALIRSGDTYQVNYTYRLRAEFGGNPWHVFRQLIAPQAPPYGAYLDIGDWVICSASPELFFRLDGTRIKSRPMKGTATRGKTQAEDLQYAAALQASEKERAENVMIVDMVRHDLGRIARTGSVKVASLCEVEEYPTVWQMTSTVEARTSASLSEIFRALFPAASVTGAPKVRTMQIIAELERIPRRLYTGTVGFLAPGRRAQFNVAIRTLLMNRADGSAEYGVGSGITWDSDPEAEWQECRAKTEILYPASAQPASRPGALPRQDRDGRPGTSSIQHPTSNIQSGPVRKPLEVGGSMPDVGCSRHAPGEGSSATPQSSDFSLLETLRWTPREGYYLLELHLERLRDSARYFGFRLDLSLLRRELKEFAAGLGRRRQRIRLVFTREGRVSLEAKALPATPAKPQEVTLARAPVDASDAFLYHKTTNRAVYEAARAACPGFDDVVLFNEAGEITESTIANVAVEIGGKLCTPPVACGLLPGTLRSHMLGQGELVERRITVAELRRARRLVLLNSVRGSYPAILEPA
jgi:para-aminobenzoate synthetase / 4-amino-4-deoxychorismate lyase